MIIMIMDLEFVYNKAHKKQSIYHVYFGGKSICEKVSTVQNVSSE